MLEQKLISRTLFTFNLHCLSHLGTLLRQLGNIRAVSSKAIERFIGFIKRVVRSTNKAGINAGNELEQEDVFCFLELASVIDFEKPFESTKDISNTFRYHPAAIEGQPDYQENKALPQQWVPFLDDKLLSDLLENPSAILGKTGVTYKQLTTAMQTYLVRLTGNSASVFSVEHKTQTLKFSQRLWCDSAIYSTESYKDSRANATRKDCYCFLNPKREGV